MRCRLTCVTIFHALLLLSQALSAAVIDLEGYRFDPLVAEPELPDDLMASPAMPGDSTLGLVQFDGPVTLHRRAALEAAGLVIVGYVPEFTYLVYGPAPLAEAIRGLEGIRWVGPFHPAFRLSPSIGMTPYVDPERAGLPYYTLRVQTIDEAEAVARTVERLGGVIRSLTHDGRQYRLLIDLPKGREVDLAQHPAVLWIEELPDYRVWNNTTRWVVQSNLDGVTPIWARGIHGENRIVAIMDTGLDYASCWFRDTGNPPPGPNHRKIMDYRTWGGNAYDGCSIGHGTHVSGTLAGDQSFINSGNYDYNGMAYAAKIAFQDVGNDDFFSCLFGLLNVPSSLTSPFQDVYALGARAHSNSWGSMSNTYDGLARDVDDFMWTHPDFLVFFAAGNSGPGSGTVGSPGTAKNCVTVGATRQAPQQNTVASYSSRGPTYNDDRYKPTVTAPGGEDPTYITSAKNTTNQSPSCNTVSSPFQGTSMATPAVAGLGLLVQQYFLEGWYPNGEFGMGTPLPPSAALVKATLVNGATDMGGLDIPNNNEGWGRLLLDDVLYFAGDSRELRIETHDGLSTGESAVFSYAVEPGEPLEIVLVWTDYPAATGTGIKLVNDLDLVVVGPGGTYLGNVFSGGQSVTGGSPDRRNVEEVVRLSAPDPGDYTMTVSAYNVPQAVEPFALVSTGAFEAWPPLDISVEQVPVAAAAGVSLFASRPNPFNPATAIRFRIDRGEPLPIQVAIFDPAGRHVRRLYSGPADPGSHRLAWNGRDDGGTPVASGTYFVRLVVGNVGLSEKITLLR